MGNLYAIQQLNISVENYICKKQHKDKNNKKIDEFSYEKPHLIVLPNLISVQDHMMV